MEKRLIPTEDPQFARLGQDGPVLNTDRKALEQYKQKRAESLQLQQLAQRQERVERDLAEIKDLLRKLVSG